MSNEYTTVVDLNKFTHQREAITAAQIYVHATPKVKRGWLLVKFAPPKSGEHYISPDDGKNILQANYDYGNHSPRLIVERVEEPITITKIDGVTGKYNGAGRMDISWDVNMHKLVSPDGQKHALPCDRCGNVYWHDHGVVSFICGECVSSPTCEHGVPYSEACHSGNCFREGQE